MGKMKIDSSGELVTDKSGRPQGAYDIYLIAATGLDWDDAPTRDVLPINLTNTDDWDEVSPSWRPY